MMRVLVVDDNEENIYYLTALLGSYGYKIDAARHGAEALLIAKESQPDIIVSDLLMPVMDGYTLLRHWKNDPKLRSIPFVVYTATYTAPEDEQLALNLGADCFILKPAEPDVFMAQFLEAQKRANSPEKTATPTITVDESIFEQYSQTLIRKLEQKMLQLELSNQALQADIAERMRIEAERDRFFNLSLDLLCIAKFNGTLEQINPAWTQSLGWSHEELKGVCWLEFVHPDQQQQASQVMQQLASGDSLRNFECQFRCKDKSYRWLSWNSYPLVEAEMTFSVVRDITEQKLFHVRIAEQATFLNKATDAILAWNLDHKIIYWNRSATTLYGWEPEEALDKSLQQLFDLTDEAISTFSRSLFATGEWSGELHTVSKLGKPLIVEVRLTLFRDDHGNPKTVLAINTDITEKKLLEAQFLRAQRLESIGTLTGGIAHDLNNILAPIMMSIEILKMSAPSKDYIDTLETLETGAKRGADLIKKLLVFGRGADGQRTLVNLSTLIEDVHQIIHETLPKNIFFELNSENSIWPINGDPTQLQQIFLNLCVNARDAMPDGGTLRISLENIELDTTYAVMNPGITAGNFVKIEISDTGTGIPPEKLERIFEPFFTTKDVGKGTGLGLSTTQALIKSHSGLINVSSKVDIGTTFTVYLPASSEGVVPKEKTSEKRPELPRGNGEWILVVDDEVGVRKIAQLTLEKFGYHVFLATNGAEAVSTYAKNQDKIALVITDMAMPTMDGHSLIAALKAMNPNIPIIGSSGLAKNQIAANSVGPTHQLFLVKPYTAATLLNAIHQLLHE